MAIPDYLYRACEEIDAAVFSGDVIYQQESRERLCFYVDRWKRAIDSYEPEPEEA